MRNVRGSRRNKAIDLDDEEGNSMDVDESLLANADEEAGEIKAWDPTKTFNSLLLWNADIAVDEGRDEYVRSLGEWTTLASSVRDF